MAYLPFPQFLNRYGIKLFYSSVADTKPGAVIETRNKGFFVCGTLEQVLGGAGKKWASRLQDANLVYGCVERTLSLKGKASLKEFGVNVEGGLNRATSVTFQISGIKARTFVSQSKLTIVPELFELRKSNKAKWRMINSNWIADHVYHATEFLVKFNVETGVDLKADLQNKVKLSGEAKLEWKTKSSFTIVNNLDVPFGFSGWRV